MEAAKPLGQAPLHQVDQQEIHRAIEHDHCIAHQVDRQLLMVRR